MKRIATVIALALALALLALTSSPARSQGQLVVTATSVDNRFPDGLVFRLSASGDLPITEVRLRYLIQPDGVLSSALPDFNSGTSVNVSFTLEGNAPPRIYIPPGVGIEYFWELTDEAGNTLTTDTATVDYVDIRFDWQDLTAGIINLHYYAGSDDVAQSMLEAARRTLDDMSALLGAQVDFPLHVWVYSSVEDMRPALVRRSESFERSVITAGERVSSDTVLVLGSSGALDTLRHELTHIATAAAGEGAFGSLPAWLDEGTAVYAQSSPGGFQAALEGAVDRGNLLSVRGISSPPGDPNTVNLFYGQSWSLVAYLIETYEPEEFAQLFATFKEGSTTDDALMAVYGFDQDGLEDEWRASLGLSPRERPEPEPDEAIPTQPPPGPGPQPQVEGGDGTSLAVIVGLLVGLLALAAVVGLGGYLLARRMR